jgi:anti-anti-sigma factor
MISVREQRTPCLSILHIHGPLRVPVGAELDRSVQALLRRGSRQILLDLSGVSDVDAGGVGKVVEVYNLTAASHGALRIAEARAHVRELFDRAGLFELLSADSHRSLPEAV